MGKNFTKQVFTQNTTWVAPAGVTGVRATVIPLTTIPSAQNGQYCNFLDSSGNLYSYGGNFAGYLGINSQVAQSSPVVIANALTYKYIGGNTVGNNNMAGPVFGITNQGIAYAWGGGTNTLNLGVGNATGASVSTPTAVVGGLKFAQIISDANNAFGLTPGGAVWYLGGGFTSTNTGVAGNGTASSYSTPVAVIGGLTFKQVLTESYAAFGVTTTGVMYAWGRNSGGVLGTFTLNVSSPVAVLGGLTVNKMFSAGGGGSIYALTTAGALYAWGSNTNGQLGLGNVTGVSSPTAVLGGLTFASFNPGAAGLGSVIGLTAAGKAYAWGVNTAGQLGLGDVIPRSSPVAVLGGLVFTQTYSDGNNSSYGLTATGALYAWGGNSNGQLGLGDVIPRSSPVAVLGGLTFAAFSCSNTVCVAMDPSGKLYGWGSNTNGMLGTGDVIARSSPVAVLGGLVSQVPQAVSQTIPVTPGTSYAINLSNFNASFGLTPLGQGPITQVILEYMS